MMEETRSLHRILLGKYLENTPLEELEKDSFKMDLNEIGCEDEGL
jgi:hypothetical protein